MSNLSAFLVGAVFAIGLGISGMTQPDKIIGFLDLFGSWDPTLLFVMLGATVMYFISYRVVRGYAPILSADFHIPTSRQIDRRLVIGSAMFGVGWGLAGFCPGPGLVSLGNGATGAIVFVASMVGGMYSFAAFNALVRRPRRSSAGSDAPAVVAPDGAAQPM